MQKHICYFCSSRMYLVEMSIPPDYINHHSTNPSFLRQRKCCCSSREPELLDPEESAAKGKREPNKHKVLWVSQEVLKGKALTWWEQQDLWGTINPMAHSWPPTALCWMHRCQHTPALPQASCFTIGFHGEQGFSQGFVSDPHQAAHEADLHPLGTACACYPRVKGWEGGFSGFHELCWTSFFFTVCSTKITSSFWDFLGALADMPQCWDR